MDQNPTKTVSNLKNMISVGAGFTRRQATLLLLVQVFCGLILVVDVTSELWFALRIPQGSFSPVHILFEVIATLIVAASAFLTFRHILVLQAKISDGDQKLDRLRHDFDEVLRGLFQKWRLSQSETDVALLTVRGLGIAEIANNRHTKQGTIKAQLSNIFRKAGVSSRPELLSLIMDELLDFKAAPNETY